MLAVAMLSALLRTASFCAARSPPNTNAFMRREAQMPFSLLAGLAA